MAGPQHIEYSKEELVNAFRTFSGDLNPAGTIKPEEIEEALVRAAVLMVDGQCMQSYVRVPLLHLRCFTPCLRKLEHLGWCLGR